MAPSVVVKNKAVNLTAVLQPSNVGTVIYYWWFDNKTEVSLTISFPTEQPIKQIIGWIYSALLLVSPCLQACCDPGWSDVLHFFQGGKSHCNCSSFSGKHCSSGPNNCGTLWCIICIDLSVCLSVLLYHSLNRWFYLTKGSALFWTLLVLLSSNLDLSEKLH